MSDSSNHGEPTMEEILASIRKIISEDDSETQAPVGAEQAAAESEQTPDDVLELTERVEDEIAAPADPPDPPEPTDPAGANEAEIDAILASVTEVEDVERPETHTAADTSEGIASSETERAVTAALSDFAGALIEQNKDLEGPIGGNQSLDVLVRSALEPYLKSWLDENLEALVERVLKEELGRMARRAENH
jgi:cell pole-organizing protein PopZ